MFNLTPSQYHSDGRLKRSEVSKKFHDLKSSKGDVVSSLTIAPARWGTITQLRQISFCGCEDGQTSVDVVKNGLAVGAMSSAFINSLSTFLVHLPFKAVGEP